MARYAGSRMRVVVLAVMLGLMLIIGRQTLGQSAAGGSTPAASATAGNTATVNTTGNTASETAGKDASGADSTLGPFGIVMANIKDPITITVFILSIIAVTLIIQGALQNRAGVLMPRESTERMREMIINRQFKELIEFTESDSSFVSQALNPALKRAPSFASMKEAMETAVSVQTAEQFRKIEYLNIIGNLGPLLGLLGTVVGMINAFQKMFANQGNANPGDLAGGVSQALTHTMLGLLLAVPCLAAFGVLRTVVDRLTIRAALEAEELLLMIKPTPAESAARPQARPAAVITRKMPSPVPQVPPTPAPPQG